MKKILKALLIIVLVIAIIPIGVFVFFAVETAIPDRFNYVVNEDQTTCTIISAKNKNEFSIDIPEEIDGYTVTKIGAWAFKGLGCASVYLPETIEYIGAGAFAECEELLSVHGLEKCSNLKEIQSQTFKDCCDLDEISLPEGLERIGFYAFLRCSSLESISIPSTVTTLENGAFSFCKKLTTITIPASVEFIGLYLFEGCISLESIEVEAENPYFCSVDGVFYTKGMEILGAYPSSKAGEEYTIPDGVTTIAPGAFAYPYYLKTLNIPDSIELIDENAFIDIYTVSKLDTINYDGTVRQWKNIYVAPGWSANYYPELTVYCINGRISKDGTITYK